jgi:hypothetical protein
MKKFYSILLLCLCTFNSTLTWAQSVPPCVPPAANPNPYIENTPFAPLERYLARTIQMGGLSSENSREPDGYRELVRCDPTRNTRWCPEQYARDIAMLADINASYIQGAAGRWGGERNFNPAYYTNGGIFPSDYLPACAQLIRDIHAAYDCKGLRHPIIQAGIYEFVAERSRNPNPPYEVWGAPIEDVLILPKVIEAFWDEMTSQQRLHYFKTGPVGNFETDSDGKPIGRDDLKFTYEEVSWEWGGVPGRTPDYTKLEGRMWIYMQAKTFIDMGYTSLHMGQPRGWAKLDSDDAPPFSQVIKDRLELLNQGMVKIRNYAASKGQPLILVAEMASADDGEFGYYGARNFYYGGYNSNSTTNTMIFDFKIAAMRPMEVGSNTSINTDRANCFTTPDPNHTETMFNGTACGGPPSSFYPYVNNATIDPCNFDGYIPDAGGVTHLGASYSQTPYQVQFDHGDGLQANYVLGANTPTGSGGTWGFDDNAWFATALTDACRAYWLPSQMAYVRKLTVSKSFMCAPGYLHGIGDTNTNGSSTFSFPYFSKDFYLSNHTSVQASVKAAWAPTVPSVTVIQDVCAGIDAGTGICKRGPGASPFIPLKYPLLHLAIENPDVTSIYTWHIQRPDNSFESWTPGDTRDFQPTMEGTYHIFVRQDNLGLDANTYGSRSYPIDVQVNKLCCDVASEEPLVVQASTNELSKEAERAMIKASMQASQRPSAAMSSTFSVSASPNPVRDALHIQIQSNSTAGLEVSLLNAVGKTVKTLSFMSAAEAATFDVNVADIPSGFYILKVRQGKAQQTSKIVK